MSFRPDVGHGACGPCILLFLTLFCFVGGGGSKLFMLNRSAASDVPMEKVVFFGLFLFSSLIVVSCSFPEAPRRVCVCVCAFCFLFCRGAAEVGGAQLGLGVFSSVFFWEGIWNVFLISGRLRDAYGSASVSQQPSPQPKSLNPQPS